MDQNDTLAKATGFGEDTRQFLSFHLNQEEYAIDILRVQEIKGYSTITGVPNTPGYIKGVMNLRGTIVPVVDLRARFAMPESQYDKFTVIIVVTVGSKVLGLVVDAVSDVLNIAGRDMQPTPDLGSGVDTSFLTGMARCADRLILMLDIDRVLHEEPLAAAV